MSPPSQELEPPSDEYSYHEVLSTGECSCLLVPVRMLGQGLVQPDEYEATARFPNILAPLLVAFPGLLAPKVLQWRSTSDTFHFGFAVLAQLFGNSDLLASRCGRSI